MRVPDYHINSSIVFSNERDIFNKGKVLYLPIYYVMFMGEKLLDEEKLYFQIKPIKHEKDKPYFIFIITLCIQ